MGLILSPFLCFTIRRVCILSGLFLVGSFILGCRKERKKMKWRRGCSGLGDVVHVGRRSLGKFVLDLLGVV